MAGEMLCFKPLNAGHTEARILQGFSLVPKSTENTVGISIGYYWAVLIQTNSIAISTDVANGPPFSIILASTTQKARRKLERGVTMGTTNVCSVSSAAPSGD